MTKDELAAWWRWFSESECRDYSPLYERICGTVAGNDTVLERLLELPRHALQPNMLLAAVHDLVLLGGVPDLADRYDGRTATDDVRQRLLSDVASAHRPVLIGLAMAIVSGVPMAASDIATFLPSPVFWGKMAAIVLLLVNGRWLQTMERGLRRSPASFAKAWPRLALASRFSYLLWFTIALGGVLLVNL